MSQHLCHAGFCTVPVPPRLLMCAKHWRMVPRHLQSEVLRHYRKGQEIDKKPSPEYLHAMRDAVLAVSTREGDNE